MACSKLPYPRPGSTGDDIERYFRQPLRAPWLSVAGQFVSAGALGQFTMSVARLGHTRARV